MGIRILLFALALATTSTGQDLDTFTTPREWTIGGKTVVAYYIGNEDGSVRIRLEDEDGALTIPIAKLSQSDREYVESLFYSSDLFIITPEVFTGKAKRVKDGDSFVAIFNGLEVEIRLHGVDAPENTQPFGKESRAALARLIRGKKLRFEKIDSDRYHPSVSVCRVYIGNTQVNHKLVEIGAAWYSDDPKLAELQEKAKRKRVGLWNAEWAVAPWEWRKTKKGPG